MNNGREDQGSYEKNLHCSPQWFSPSGSESKSCLAFKADAGHGLDRFPVWPVWPVMEVGQGPWLDMASTRCHSSNRSQLGASVQSGQQPPKHTCAPSHIWIWLLLTLQRFSCLKSRRVFACTNLIYTWAECWQNKPGSPDNTTTSFYWIFWLSGFTGG